ncbi:MAG TPA: phosphotransferase family protein [Acidocella sp.]|nr:phosphotransferase family protein [Acidocella sp.]
MSGAKLVEPLPAHRFDPAPLFAYLRDHLEDFPGEARLLQFQGGQSNPTFLLETVAHKYVLRKKPPGQLLASAHQIDREYRIQQALRGTDVPVVPMRLYCADPAIIGTEFYIMDFLPGRVFGDVLMPDLSPAERGAVQRDLFTTIGRLHRLDYGACGLADFGRPTGYAARQLARWRGQYEASQTEDVPAMTKLMAWLGAHVPERDESAIAHGDFRLGNMMVHPSDPRIIAVLDWELATLGHPLADLAYCCMPFHLPRIEGPLQGYGGLDLAAHGLANEDDMLALYCRVTGRYEIVDWKFFLGFAMFRSAAIAEGVYARALAGNAADTRGIAMHEVMKVMAQSGWEVVG